MIRGTISMLLAILAGLALAAPVAQARDKRFWTETRAERYMEGYNNILNANCSGRGDSVRSREGKRMYRRHVCVLVYTDITTGLAMLVPTYGRPYVKFFS